MTPSKTGSLAACVVCGFLAGCNVGAHPTHVNFKSSRPLGQWQTPSAAEPDQAPEVPTSPIEALTAGTGNRSPNSVGPVAGMPAEDAGNASSVVISTAGGTGGASIPSGSAGTSSVVRGEGPFSFDVTTHEQHHLLNKADPDFDDYAYGPRNAGAIWIQNAEGGLVRTLQLWADVRLTDLSQYNRARDLANSAAVDRKLVKPEPDAVSSATLDVHQPHHVTWDMKDSAGNPAPAGKYSLFVEVCDYQNTTGTYPGETVAVEFDISNRPQTMNPVQTQWYTDMKLQLQ